ncbi:transcription factor, partial [Trifolium medium]|nr:transcription factor [Trifolium medium]
MRIKVSTAKATRAPKLELETIVGNAYRYRNVSQDVEEPPQRKVESHVQECFTKTIICGIILDDGST